MKGLRHLSYPHLYSRRGNRYVPIIEKEKNELPLALFAGIVFLVVDDLFAFVVSALWADGVAIDKRTAVIADRFPRDLKLEVGSA